jgi:low affinity Fe/Cu permease
MNHIFERISARVALATGQPQAFIIAALIILIWGITGPIFRWSDTWQLVINTGTTVVTFLMVFLIQSAQNRDGSAIQCKLDELIRAQSRARNQFIGIEHLTAEQLISLKAKLEELAGDEEAHQRSVELLIARR